MIHQRTFIQHLGDYYCNHHSHMRWMPCRCNDKRTSHECPQETGGQNDSALHFILDFCTFFSHYKVDLLWSPRGLKLLSRSLCVILKKNPKPKIAKTLINALSTTCHFQSLYFHFYFVIEIKHWSIRFKQSTL